MRSSATRRLGIGTVAGYSLVLAALHGAAMAQPSFIEVAPIFQQRCIVCHSGANAPLGLRLDSYDGLMTGSVNGPVVVPGSPETSELVRRIRGESLPRMPLTGPPFLDDEQIALIEAWVAAGAAPPEPAGTTPPAPALPAPGEPVTFAHVEPIFLQRCAYCHSDGGILGQPPEELRLVSYETVVGGGERVVVVPGRPEASELLRRIVGQALPRMPFDGPPFLDEEQIALIREWIAQGALDSQGQAASLPVGGELRLHGILTERWALDGLPLVVTRSTRIDGEVGPGDYVEVRGVLGPGGEVLVERIRER